MITVTKADIGKRMVFQAATRWSGAKATRKINGIDEHGRPTVRYGGHAAFIVKPEEIIEIKEGCGMKNISIWRWNQGISEHVGSGKISGYPRIIDCEADLPEKVFQEIERASIDLDKGLVVVDGVAYDYRIER